MPDDESQVEIDVKNYAEDADANTRAVKFLQEVLPSCRSDRAAFDADGKQLYNIWDAKRDIHYYRGRANIYIPSGHKAIERASAKQLGRLFPSGEDCFDITTLPEGEDSEEIAQELESNKALMSYNLHQSMKIMSWILPFLRQLNILGTSPIAVDYVTQEEVQAYTSRKQYRLSRRQAPEEGNPLVSKAVPHMDEVGPTGRPVDLFTWFVWPPTTQTLTTEGVMVFEDKLVSEATLKKWRKAGRYAFEDAELRVHAGKAPDSSIWAANSRMQERGVATSDPDNNLYVLTTPYASWLPQDTKDSEPIPCQFGLINDTLCIEARQNQKWHQRPPYTAATLFRYIDEFYGRGLVHFTRSLGYLINDLANQTLDGMSYTLNPIACVDPDFPDPDLLQYRPGAKWPIDAKKVFFLQIPDKSAQGFAAIRQLYEFSQDVAGASTGGMHLPTLGLSRGAETATGQSLLIAQGDIDVNAIVMGIEKDCIEPMLSMVDSMEQQFLPIQGDRVLRALGPQAMPLLQKGMRVRRDQMLGTRTYHWTGNAISEQRETFQKHGPAMLKILAELKATNDPDYTITLAPFVKDLYRSYSFPNADEIIKIHEPGNGFDPELEHAVMSSGWPVIPRWGEEYRSHLEAHNTALPAAMTAGWGDRLRKHMFKTLALMQQAGAKSIGPGNAGAMPPPGGPQGPAVPPGVPGGGNVVPGSPGGASPGGNAAQLIAMLRARQQGGV